MHDDAMFGSLGRLVVAIGRREFGDTAFELVDKALGADHLVVTLVGRAELRSLLTRGRLPARTADTLNQRYLERYHLLDRSLPPLWDMAGEEPVVLPFEQQPGASPLYQAFFFEHTGLCDRLSIVARRNEYLLLCNLYRMAASGPFGPADRASARVLAPPLAAAAWLHADNQSASRTSRPEYQASGNDNGNGNGNGNGNEAALRTLSPREMDVCRRLLVGASNEGIALDLSISTHTVRTLRKRIYRKLGVGSLADLFSRYRQLVVATCRAG